MSDDRAVSQPHADAGIASAESGFVILDGPGEVALTFTPQAAARTAQSLSVAAAEAERQAAAGEQGDISNRGRPDHVD